MENLELKREQMRAEAKVQIAEQDEQNFERFCSFVDDLEAHDSTKAMEGLAEVQRADNLAKMIQFTLQQQVLNGEIKIKE